MILFFFFFFLVALEMRAALKKLELSECCLEQRANVCECVCCASLRKQV